MAKQSHNQKEKKLRAREREGHERGKTKPRRNTSRNIKPAFPPPKGPASLPQKSSVRVPPRTDGSSRLNTPPIQQRVVPRRRPELGRGLKSIKIILPAKYSPREIPFTYPAPTTTVRFLLAQLRAQGILSRDTTYVFRRTPISSNLTESQQIDYSEVYVFEF